jgi:hypothetical protein
MGMWLAAALGLTLAGGPVQAGRGGIRLAVRERTCLCHQRISFPVPAQIIPFMRVLS